MPKNLEDRDIQEAFEDIGRVTKCEAPSGFGETEVDLLGPGGNLFFLFLSKVAMGSKRKTMCFLLFVEVFKSGFLQVFAFWLVAFGKQVFLFIQKKQLETRIKTVQEKRTATEIH